MSYSKYAMASLSYLLSFYTIPISLFFNSNFFYFLVSLLFLCIHAYIKSSGFIGGKGPRPLKIAIFPDNGNVGLGVCAKFHDHTYAVLYAHSSV